MKRKPEPIAQEDWDAVESPPLTDKMLAAMRPVLEVHPNIPHRVRGPQKRPTKVALSLRVSPEVAEYFRATGAGWQSRMDEALKEWIARHPR